jgi:hypothetical protein
MLLSVALFDLQVQGQAGQEAYPDVQGALFSTPERAYPHISKFELDLSFHGLFLLSLFYSLISFYV